MIADQVLTERASHEVTGDKIRLVDYDIRPGVDTDMGDGDQWPEIRRRILDAVPEAVAATNATAAPQRRPPRAGTADTTVPGRELNAAQPL
ncbi:hypothetical protein ACFTZB_39925 [Rhodococcus sp. NPDC057014]|uniref:hypothetical protein n=1 Tax=Rhodococcus sp. NPDC057014 TaxID=3346000 RepID=UPI0036437068